MDTFPNQTGPPLSVRAPCWFWPLRSPPAVQRAAANFAGVAAPFCRGWRWIASALAGGALPFAFSFATGLPGHQAVSALCVTLLGLACVRAGDWRKSVATVALAFLAHSALVIVLAGAQPQRAAALLPNAAEYWEKQLRWIQTGQDPEYELSAWVPAHLQLLGGTLLYTYTSLGGLTFYEGFREVDLMNFYNAQLLNRSGNRAWALLLGWHVWSLARGIGFLLLSLEIAAISLERLTNSSLPQRRGRSRRLVAGLALLVLDGLLKWLLLDTVRRQMLLNLIESA